ncbi:MULTISPECIES: SDR family NAD(P)-dependent oxidoreductase [Paenibacillus]|uniref:SDR family NAD(P)-dependent oxidoreductase n=1 Tax=Paenibacillus TaxID=44249 RepID=UPI0013D1AD12|nr:MULTISPECIES: glucose 1-dehydrogenase [Paenibacillus]MDR9745904.1 glucose 1-dehydrogenase [Paenibacillus taichungensis]NEU60146.1 glucose 1-dehydrogenase [Paenibacillus sp. ALJ109b]
MSFTDQVVVVTGAAKGIGRSVAEAYAVAGAKVVLADYEEAEGAAAAASIRNEGGEAIFVQCDVRQEKDITNLIQTTMDEFKQIDVLINNAGVSRWKSPYELTLEEWDDILNTNVRSCFLASREAAKHMKHNENGGAIVNMASTRAFMSEPETEAYAASKGAIVALTHAMAVSLGKDKIRVNCISPGWIETGNVEKLKPEDHEQHPAGRVGVPSDISRACLYLSDPSNTFVTGTNLIIDGGMTRKMIYED